MKKEKTGMLRTWIPSRGFGFIEVVNEWKPEKFYLHCSKIESGVPVIGARCDFDIDPVRQGESPAAIRCAISDEGGAQ